MATFVAFSDESGVADPGGEFLVSGHIADERDWPLVVRAWQARVLDGPPALPYLHMSEIRRDEWRRQHRISFNDAEERVAEAVRVLYSMGPMLAVVSVIKRKDLQEVFHNRFKRKKQVPLGLDEPDYLCFIAYATILLAEVHRRYPVADRVNFVVSSKQKVTDRLSLFVEDMKQLLGANVHPELAPMLGKLVPGSMEDQIPLQAADLLGWHMQRYYARTLERVDESRLWMLTKERDGHTHEWQRPELEQLAERLRLI